MIAPVKPSLAAMLSACTTAPTASFDDDLKAIQPDYRFYYECLMAPNARSVLSAMKRGRQTGRNNHRRQRTRTLTAIQRTGTAQ